jgi:hypothetical protein
VTPTGDVWSWGAGASGRLGDGGIANRATPQAVLTAVADWAPAAPTIDLPSGALSAPQMVTITSSTPGATIRYTLNGTAPTETDTEVAAGGQVEIAYSSLLRARAFVSGRLPGAMGRAEYELQSAAPVISPPTGTYSSAQTRLDWTELREFGRRGRRTICHRRSQRRNLSSLNAARSQRPAVRRGGKSVDEDSEHSYPR